MALLSLSASAQKYVKPVSTGTGDGSSWTDASSDLQAMINASATGEEVWVVAGTYKPTQKLLGISTDNRDKTFILKAGVKIFGGFGGTETLLTERNMDTNVTILSGDLNSDDVASMGDAYHVVASAGSSTGAVLDGFTIQHGFGDATSTVSGVRQNQGAAINITNEETSVIFKNLIIKDNKCSGTGNGAAGVYLSLSDASNTVLDHIVFDNNIASASGGSLYYISNSGSPSLTVSNSKVFGSRGTSGAGFYINGTSGNVPNFTVFNTIFSENRATSSPGGGAIYTASYTNSTVINCTFYNNSSSNGAISYGNFSTTDVKIYNSIFNKNSTNSAGTTPSDLRNLSGSIFDLRNNLFQLSPVEDTDPEYNNIINNTPTLLFFSTTSSAPNFLKLVEGAATEKGANTYVTTNSITKDLAGADRITHTNVDLGAYEYQGVLPIKSQSFSVKKANNGALLEWKVASETDNEKFIVKRSINGSHFEIIGEVYSKGNHNQTQNYSFTDHNPLKGDNYYQLSQIDKDGSTETFALKVLNFDFSGSDVSIYPNPVSDFVKIKIGAAFSSDLIQIQLVSIAGNTVFTKQFKNNVADEITLEVSQYAPGVYVLVIHDGKAITKREIILY